MSFKKQLESLFEVFLGNSPKPVEEQEDELFTLTEEELLEKDEQWMQNAFSKHKGSLHKALDVNPDKKIPKYKLKKALRSSDIKVKRKAFAAVNANPDVYGSLKKSKSKKK